MKEVTKFDYKTRSVSVEYVGTNPCKEIPIPTYNVPLTGVYIKYSDTYSWYGYPTKIPVKSDEDTGKEFWE